MRITKSLLVYPSVNRHQRSTPDHIIAGMICTKESWTPHAAVYHCSDDIENIETLEQMPKEPDPHRRHVCPQRKRSSIQQCRCQCKLRIAIGILVFLLVALTIAVVKLRLDLLTLSEARHRSITAISTSGHRALMNFLLQTNRTIERRAAEAFREIERCHVTFKYRLAEAPNNLLGTTSTIAQRTTGNQTIPTAQANLNSFVANATGEMIRVADRICHTPLDQIEHRHSVRDDTLRHYMSTINIVDEAFRNNTNLTQDPKTFKQRIVDDYVAFNSTIQSIGSRVGGERNTMATNNARINEMEEQLRKLSGRLFGYSFHD